MAAYTEADWVKQGAGNYKFGKRLDNGRWVYYKIDQNGVETPSNKNIYEYAQKYHPETSSPDGVDTRSNNEYKRVWDGYQYKYYKRPRDGSSGWSTTTVDDWNWYQDNNKGSIEPGPPLPDNAKVISTSKTWDGSRWVYYKTVEDPNSGTKQRTVQIDPDEYARLGQIEEQKYDQFRTLDGGTGGGKRYQLRTKSGDWRDVDKEEYDTFVSDYPDANDPNQVKNIEAPKYFDAQIIKDAGNGKNIYKLKTRSGEWRNVDRDEYEKYLKANPDIANTERASGTPTYAAVRKVYDGAGNLTYQRQNDAGNWYKISKADYEANKGQPAYQAPTTPTETPRKVPEGDFSTVTDTGGGEKAAKPVEDVTGEQTFLKYRVLDTNTQAGPQRVRQGLLETTDKYGNKTTRWVNVPDEEYASQTVTSDQLPQYNPKITDRDPAASKKAWEEYYSPLLDNPTLKNATAAAADQQAVDANLQSRDKYLASAFMSNSPEAERAAQLAYLKRMQDRADSNTLRSGDQWFGTDAGRAWLSNKMSGLQPPQTFSDRTEDQPPLNLRTAVAAKGRVYGTPNFDTSGWDAKGQPFVPGKPKTEFVPQFQTAPVGGSRPSRDATLFSARDMTDEEEEERRRLYGR